jgi:two-component system phosphate regulon response regulator PhoB
MAHIVILDDEPDLVEACQMILEASGHRVEPLSVSKGALPVLRRVRPDLLLVDLIMPDVDGGEVVAALRLDEEVRGTPVLMMSAMIDGAHRAEELGADAYLAKPFSADQLLAALSLVLARIGEPPLRARG